MAFLAFCFDLGSCFGNACVIHTQKYNEKENARDAYYFKKQGKGRKRKRQCGVRAKPTPEFPRVQLHEVTSAEKNSFSPPLIPIRKKKKNEPCLGRKQRFPQASAKVETLKSLVGSHQAEALPGFTPTESTP